MMRLILISILCLFATSCGRGSTTQSVIKVAGTYPSPDGRHVLHVTRTGGGIINYSVTDAAGEATGASGGGFSTYHRWFFYWDSANRLWTYNSDKGPFAVHAEKSAKVWHTTLVDASSPLITAMPEPVRENLPETLKRVLQLP